MRHHSKISYCFDKAARGPPGWGGIVIIHVILERLGANSIPGTHTHRRALPAVERTLPAASEIFRAAIVIWPGLY